MSITEHNRWRVEPEQFAVRVTAADLEACAKRNLVVEPGTRAILIRDGVLDDFPEIPPGEYPFDPSDTKTWFGRVRRTGGQTTAILCRMEDASLPILLPDVLTAENLLVEMQLRVVVQIDAVDQFLHNFMGASTVVTARDLKKAVGPLLDRAVREVVGNVSIEEFGKPGFAKRLGDAVDEQLQADLGRYGLNFVDVLVHSARHEKLDELNEKVAEAFLIQAGIERQAALDDVYEARELAKLKRRERVNELRVLAARVEHDNLESRLSARLERIELRKQVLDALNEEKFVEHSGKEDLLDKLMQIDERRLLRREELAELKEGFEQRRDDRAGQRKLLATKMELERKREILELRQEIDHGLRMQAAQHAIALAERVACGENAKWARKLEKEREAAEFRRDVARQKSDDQLERLAKVQELNAAAADRDFERDLRRIEALRGVEGDILIATSNPENAALLADVHRARAEAAAGHGHGTPTDGGWYLSVNGQATGPVTLTELRRRATVGEIACSTYILRPGGEWQTAESVTDLRDAFPPPPPPA